MSFLKTTFAMCELVCVCGGGGGGGFHCTALIGELSRSRSPCTLLCGSVRFAVVVGGVSTQSSICSIATVSCTKLDGALLL